MNAFTFISPWLLLGLLALFGPLLIHLIRAPRAQSVYFSAFEYLENMIVHMAQKERLKKKILLLIRLLFLLCLVLALAQPGFLKPSRVQYDKLTWVVIIDTSSSMAYQYHGQTLLETAKKQALAFLKAHHADNVEVFLTAKDNDKESLSLGNNTQTLPNMIEQLQVSQRIKPAHQSVQIAHLIEQSLNKNGQNPVSVFIFSDLSKNLFDVSIHALTQLNSEKIESIHLVPAWAESDSFFKKETPTLWSLPNIGLVQIEKHLNAESQQELQVEVQNFSHEPSSVEIRLLEQTRILSRQFLNLSPEQKTQINFSLNLQDGQTHSILVKLISDKDGYAYDNEAFVYLDGSLRKPILLVNGDAKSPAYLDELFYLEKALQTAVPRIDYDTIKAEQFPLAQVDKYQAFFFANVGQFKESSVLKMKALLKNNKGFFFSLGDQITDESAYITLKDFLPAPLRQRWSNQKTTPDERVLIEQLQWSHPLFQQWEKNIEEVFFKTPVMQHFFVETEALKPEQILLALSSGAPLLIEQRISNNTTSGRVLLLTSTIDKDWSHLAISPLFQPLMVSIVRYLTQELSLAPEVSLTAFNASLSPAYQAYFSHYAKERGLYLKPILLNQDFLGRVPQLNAVKPKALSLDANFEQAGAYALFKEQDLNTPLPQTAFTVTPSLQESDFHIMTPALLVKQWNLAPEQVKQESKNTLPMSKKIIHAQEFNGFSDILLWMMVVFLTCEGLLIFAPVLLKQFKRM